MKNLFSGFADFIGTHAFLSKKTLSILGILTIALAVPLTVYLSQQSQDIRQRASGGTNLLSSDMQSATVNGTMRYQQFTKDNPPNIGDNKVLGNYSISGTANPADGNSQGSIRVDIYGADKNTRQVVSVVNGSNHPFSILDTDWGFGIILVTEKGTVNFPQLLLSKDVETPVPDFGLGGSSNHSSAVNQCLPGASGARYKLSGSATNGGRIILNHAIAGMNLCGGTLQVRWGEGFEAGVVSSPFIEYQVLLPTLETPNGASSFSGVSLVRVMTPNVPLNENMINTSLVVAQKTQEFTTPGTYGIRGDVAPATDGAIQVDIYNTNGTFARTVTNSNDFTVGANEKFFVILRAYKGAVQFTSVNLTLAPTCPTLTQNNLVKFPGLGGDDGQKVYINLLASGTSYQIHHIIDGYTLTQYQTPGSTIQNLDSACFSQYTLGTPLQVTPTPTTGAVPTAVPTSVPTAVPTGIPTAVPTIANSPTPTTPTATNTPVATATPVANSVSLSFNVALSGIGAGSTILNTQRNIMTELLDRTGQLVATPAASILTYDSTSNSFKGSVSLASVAPGAYTPRIKVNQYLKKKLNIIVTVPAIPTAQTIPVAPLALVVGDITNDNILNLQDYNALLACYDTKKATCGATKWPSADLNDDGAVDIFDYNILIRGFSVRNGD